MKTRLITLLLALIMLLSGCAALAAETEPGIQEQTALAGADDASAVAPMENGDETAGSGAFTDVAEDSFYFEAVNWAVENGITNGLTDTTFGPDDGCNRAQVVTFLWRLNGETAPASRDTAFNDVEKNSWYEDAVLWAVEKGITTGVTETAFNPGGNCLRAQVVTFLWRAVGEPEPTSTENPFADVEESEWYCKAVLWAVENGITNGVDANNFGPAQECNRAQIVTFLYRYHEGVRSDPEVTEPTDPSPTDPTDPKPTDPTDPKPTDPTDPKPTDPTEPKPTDPTDPMPTNPTDPKPTDPTDPMPTDPTDPKPTDPTEPAPTEDPNMGEWA